MSLLLFIWLILTAAGFIGRGRAYSGYAAERGSHSGVSLVMRGLHDHVFPWSDAPQTGHGKDSDLEEEDDEGQEISLAEAASAGGEDASESESENKTKDKAAENSGEKGEAASQSAGSENASETEEAASKNGSGEGTSEKEEAASQSAGSKNASETEEAASKGASEKNASTKEETASESGSAKKISSEKEPSPDPDGYAVPSSSCSSVVPAKNYGVAKKEYLSPEDTVYNTDREGLFAPNGIYYSLQEVSDSYFSDALFVGDSRTVGLYEYGNMESMTSFLAKESTTVYDLLKENEKMTYTPKGKDSSELTLRELLAEKNFRKIYLSVGVNELGIPDTEDYYEEYRRVIKKIHKLQPEAVIYIQGIMHVSKAKSSRDPVYNNTAIVQRNRAISTLANGRSIFYIDINSEVCDRDGNLLDDLSGDGIHLKASAYKIWYRFLKNNAAIVPD